MSTHWSPSHSQPRSAQHRSKSAGSVSRASSFGGWSSITLVRDENAESPAPSPKVVEPADQPLVSVTELNLLDEVTVGCSAGSIRLEGLTRGTISEPSSPTTTAGGRRPEVGSKYLTPFAVRDPVLVQFSTGRLTIRRADGDRRELASVSFDRVQKIVHTVTGVSITGEGKFAVELSIHDDRKAEMLVKLLHAKTRGAPPPKETRPPTRPIRPKHRSGGSNASTRSHSNGRNGDPSLMEPTRKSIREPLSARTPSRSPALTPRDSGLLLNSAQQAENDRERRRAELYRQLNQMKSAAERGRSTR